MSERKEKLKLRVRVQVTVAATYTHIYCMHSERWRGREGGEEAQMPLAKRNKLLPFFKLRKKKKKKRERRQKI